MGGLLQEHRARVRVLQKLECTLAPLLFVISFVARELLSMRGSLSSSRATWCTLRLVSSSEAMVILPKRLASFRLYVSGRDLIP